jgi:molecular chaperone GrpE
LEKDDNEIEEIEKSEHDETNMKEELTKVKTELDLVKEELCEAKESSENNLNKLKYMMADFDNYRKQMDKQMALKIESSKAELLLKFLNIRDDYLRALETAKQSKSEPVVIEGLEVILKNLDSLLTSEGVIEIETIGTPFDPNVHDAISFSYQDDVPENTVTDEIRKGYILNNKVLRPSLVEISKKIVKNTVNDKERIEKESGN